MMKTNSKSLNALHDTAWFLYNIMLCIKQLAFFQISMTLLIWYHLTVNATLLKSMASWPEFPSDFPLMKQLNLKRLGFVYVDFSLQFHHTLPLKTSRIQHSKFLISRYMYFKQDPLINNDIRVLTEFWVNWVLFI